MLVGKNKDTKKISRREFRKEKRRQKKQRKMDYYKVNKTFGKKNMKENEPGRFVRIQKEIDVQKIKENIISSVVPSSEKKQSTTDRETELEKKKFKELKIEMRKQRIRALNEENEKEGKTIKQLEKKLKLNKRKSKTTPKSFVDCGLDYILDVCDSDKIQAAVSAEMNLHDSDSEYEEDLAFVMGTGSKKEKSKILNKNEAFEESDAEDNLAYDSSFMEDEEIEDQHNIMDSTFEESSVELQDHIPIIETNKNFENNKVIKKGQNKTPSSKTENSSKAASVTSGGDRTSSKVEILNKSKKNISEATIQGKKRRSNNSDHECLSDANAEEEKIGQEIWEDIYGRTRDKFGNFVKVKYVPPHLREKSSNDDSKKREVLERIKKQLKGLLNRLAENNMHSISTQIDEMYMKNSRNDMNETIFYLYMDSLISQVHTPERLIMEHAMLIAILQANVGTEVGAFFLQNLVKKFDVLHSKEIQEIEDKQLDNLLLLLSHFYTFKIYYCQLLYDILNRLCESFKPKDIDLILIILRSVGFTLRKDDPLALKQLIMHIQRLANEASDLKDDARVRFMLDILLGIKNNNMSKIPGYDPTHSEHLKKIIKPMFRKGNYLTELKISLEDLLKADERGRWWIVGSAWEGPAPQTKEKDDTVITSSLPLFTQEVLELAKKQRMNTVNRKNIFCILMTAEDYLDAFEKLLKLGLRGQPEQEIVHVLIHCLLSENAYNPYYTHVAEQLCLSDRRHRMTIQFSVWDRFKELKNLRKSQITNLAKFLAHLFLQKSLPISVLKVVEFVELDKPGVRLIRQVLMTILLHEDQECVLEVFRRIASPAKLAPLRQSLALFLHHFLLNKSKDKKVLKEEKLLQDRIELLDKILNGFS